MEMSVSSSSPFSSSSSSSSSSSPSSSSSFPSAVLSNTGIAYKQWLLENEVRNEDDDLYIFNEEEHDRLLQEKPWTNPAAGDYFKKVKISAVALIKMVTHARSGGNIEIMGLMNGKICGDTFVVMDAFALPVEGTETRVNAGAQANEYMVTFQEYSEMVGKQECICGWYHSHPGYGCWLSGIDVQTQLLYQQHQEPFLAIVIDPIKTCAAGKVEIGAFRCYPANYVPPNHEVNEFQQIPLDKIEDFGLHWKQYYSLPIEVFKSNLDTKVLNGLWGNYWIAVLSDAPLITNKSYHTNCIADIAGKSEKCAAHLENHSECRGGAADLLKKMSGEGKQQHQLYKLAKQSLSAASEQLQGLAHHLTQAVLFHRAGGDEDEKIQATHTSTHTLTQ